MTLERDQPPEKHGLQKTNNRRRIKQNYNNIVSCIRNGTNICNTQIARAKDAILHTPIMRCFHHVTKFLCYPNKQPLKA